MSNLFKSKKKETQKIEFDPRIYGPALENLQFARQIADIPFTPYGGQLVAPFTRDYMTGEAMTRAIAGEGGFVPEVEGAARSAGQLMGFTPERVAAERVGTQFAPERVAAERAAIEFGAAPITAGQIGTQFTPERVAAQQLGTTFGARDVGAALAGGPQRVSAGQVGTTFAARDIAAPGAAPTAQAARIGAGTSISDYMNPYQQGVIDVGLSDIDRASEQARMQRGARATAARAFGGSRAAVEEGIAAGEAARERNRFIAEQRAQGFREAAGLREADVAREQQANLANLQAAQETMRLAQAGQISNQERDLRLAQLGSSAEQFNVGQGMQAQLANQQAMQDYMRMGLTAEQANQQAQLDAQRMGLTAGQSNQQAALQAALANQQMGMQGQQMGMQAQQFNVQQQMEAQRASMEAQLRAQGMSAEQARFNSQQAMQASLANQQAGMQAQQFGLQAQGMNQDAAMRAALANQQMGLAGAQFQLGAGRQFADLGQQALQNRYGAASAMTGIGAAQQGLYQNLLDRQYQEFMRQQNYPLQQLAIRQGAVQATPMQTTTTGTTTFSPPPWESAFKVASAVAPFIPSDERMKEDIEPIRNPLDKIRRLEGVTFNWKDDDDKEEDASIIAQDVEKVMPSAIDESEGYKRVSVPQMIGLLTESVKELDKKISKKRKKK